MSRSAVPSRAQVEMLVESLEERRWLATGHARTAHARERTQAAWQEIAIKLNSDGSGCIKSWKQWSKYWKDKKSAVKRKAIQIRMAGQRTRGGELEEGFLSDVEEKIISIMAGESSVTGDKELEIDLHPDSEPGPSFHLTADVSNVDDDDLSIQDVIEEENATPASESILQSVEHSTAGMLQTEQSTPSIADVQPGPSRHREHIREMKNQSEEMFEARSPPAVPHRTNAPIASSSPRRRRTARRRLIHRSPPSQMARLTERFVAIEERRLENEKRALDIFKEISESWSRQTQALLDLCASIRRGS